MWDLSWEDRKRKRLWETERERTKIQPICVLVCGHVCVSVRLGALVNTGYTGSIYIDKRINEWSKQATTYIYIGIDLNLKIFPLE